jgi:ACS family tartrate transporter-like MFS transporter
MTATPSVAEAERAVIRKVAVRLLPFLTFLYIIAYLDRVNVGFAALTMNQDIGLSNTAYGFGAGVFFIGYLLFELPSNLALQRFGARRWIARIMLSWGVVSMAMIYVEGPWSFYALRFLLGVTEAGFFPGIILYLTYWFPNRARGVAMGGFLIGIPLANIIGAPISTAIMQTSVFGLSGWRTMFLLEGIPAIVMAFVVLYVLRDSPRDAPWLTDGEKRTLLDAIERDGHSTRHVSLKAGLLSLHVWGFTLCYFGLCLGNYGFGFWVPKIIKSLGEFSDREVGWLVVIPFACSAIAMTLWGRHSDRTGERTWHVALPALIGAAGFVCGSLSGNIWISMVSFSVGAIGIYSTVAVFWTMPTAVLAGSAAAAGIAMINSIGNVAGLLAPTLVGYFKDRTGSYTWGLVALASGLVLTGLVALVMGGRQRHVS